MDQVQVTYDRSSGPGGQNVNKVNTKVDLRFQVKTASFISDKVKERLMKNVRNYFFDSAILIIQQLCFSSKLGSTVKDF